MEACTFRVYDTLFSTIFNKVHAISHWVRGNLQAGYILCTDWALCESCFVAIGYSDAWQWVQIILFSTIIFKIVHVNLRYSAVKSNCVATECSLLDMERCFAAIWLPRSSIDDGRKKAANTTGMESISDIPYIPCFTHHLDWRIPTKQCPREIPLWLVGSPTQKMVHTNKWMEKIMVTKQFWSVPMFLWINHISKLL